MFLDFLHPEIEKVPFEEIENKWTDSIPLQLREEIGFDDYDDMAQTKSAVKSRLYFPQPENRSVPKFMNIKSYMFYRGAGTNLKWYGQLHLGYGTFD